MDSLCTAALLVLALCGPATAPHSFGPATASTIVRVSPSTDLLGRQIAAAPSEAPDRPWGNPDRLAYCASAGIQASRDGGQSWSRVPTDGVAALAAGTELPLALRPGQAPSCQSVVLDPHDPDAFYAVFEVVRPPQDAPPPWFAAGYVTRDAGRSWQPVPAPPVANDLQFRGFAADGTGVQALFAPAPSNPGTEAVPPVVLATTDAAQSWQPVPFACPASGACIRWGAPPTAIGSCAMHGYGQPLLISDDGGQTWRSATGARVANACFPNELVAISDRDVLLLAPAADELEAVVAPIRVSHDGGLTFTSATLPIGPDPTDLFELHLLPGERLLAHVSGPTPGPGWTWQILWHDSTPPAQYRRCTVANAPLPSTGAPPRVVGDRVWWIDGSGQPASLPLTQVRCAD
jgi:hypothetical protein